MEYNLKLDVVERITLCKFRCGNHKLPIATCRYLPDQVSQLCTLCNLQVQGDEFHYLLVCPFFSETRRHYIKRYFSRRPNVIKFHQLFSSKSIKTLKNLSRFCKIIMLKFV